MIHKQNETHGCVINIVATDAMALNHQATSIHSVNAGKMITVLQEFHMKTLHLQRITTQILIKFWQEWPVA